MRSYVASHASRCSVGASWLLVALHAEHTIMFWSGFEFAVLQTQVESDVEANISADSLGASLMLF